MAVMANVRTYTQEQHEESERQLRYWQDRTARVEEALREITEVCRSGDFYKDYDESCAIIGRCDKAMED